MHSYKLWFDFNCYFVDPMGQRRELFCVTWYFLSTFFVQLHLQMPLVVKTLLHFLRLPRLATSLSWRAYQTYLLSCFRYLVCQVFCVFWETLFFRCKPSSSSTLFLAYEIDFLIIFEKIKKKYIKTMFANLTGGCT